VPAPSFVQTERRSLLVPILCAVVLIALAALVQRHFYAPGNLQAELVKTEVLANKSVFKSDTIVVAPQETSYTLLVACTVRFENRERLPISLDEFALTLTDSSGAQHTEKAVYPPDLANLETMFPRLKPLAAQPLLRDTSIAPGQSAEGTLVFSLPYPVSVWNTRTSAVLEIIPYRQKPINLTIPH
jgi:hypothetical protein